MHTTLINMSTMMQTQQETHNITIVDGAMIMAMSTMMENMKRRKMSVQKAIMMMITMIHNILVRLRIFIITSKITGKKKIY